MAFENYFNVKERKEGSGIGMLEQIKKRNWKGE
jgi:hypothetical protein